MRCENIATKNAESFRRAHEIIPIIHAQKLHWRVSVQKRGFSMLVATLGLASMPIDAQEAVNIADIRCVVIGMTLAGGGPLGVGARK